MCEDHKLNLLDKKIKPCSMSSLVYTLAAPQTAIITLGGTLLAPETPWIT